MLSNLPKNWADIKVYQFQELNDLKLQSIEDDDMSSVDFLMNKISIILDIPIDDELLDFEFDELFDIAEKVQWINQKPPTNANNIIKLNEQSYHLIELNQLTLGEFIDLEHFFAEDYHKNLPIICSILYKKQKKDEWNNTIIEPYIYDVYQRAKLFEDIEIQKVYGIIDMYLRFKKIIIDTYKSIFSNDDDEQKPKTEEELPNPEKESALEKKRRIEEEQQEENNRKYSWEKMIYQISNGDIIQGKKIFDLKLIYVLNQVSMKQAFEI